MEDKGRRQGYTHQQWQQQGYPLDQALPMKQETPKAPKGSIVSCEEHWTKSQEVWVLALGSP